ncbi:NADP-dependent oxidoreductase domain-containing protein [Mycena vitilis]|nr:NADP-dependent oxidoreductase domain-containing protein [Mycena vitilis]
MASVQTTPRSWNMVCSVHAIMLRPTLFPVRLGQSGLKISKIVLGCMSYGNPNWMVNWVLGEEEASEQIKAAYDAGINTFDTANRALGRDSRSRDQAAQELPRDEIVILTKVFFLVARSQTEMHSLGRIGPQKSHIVLDLEFSRMSCPLLTHWVELSNFKLTQCSAQLDSGYRCHRFIEPTFNQGSDQPELKGALKVVKPWAFTQR